MGNQNVKAVKRKVQRALLNADAIEIVLRSTQNGRLSVRTGEILQVPKVRGTTVLLLDYDTKQKPSARGIRNRLHLAKVQTLSLNCFRSPSGSGWHCIVRIRGRWNRYQCIALQALCESDPEREAQNFYRAQIFTDKEWFARGNVLFKNSKG